MIWPTSVLRRSLTTNTAQSGRFWLQQGTILVDSEEEDGTGSIMEDDNECTLRWRHLTGASKAWRTRRRGSWSRTWRRSMYRCSWHRWKVKKARRPRSSSRQKEFILFDSGCRSYGNMNSVAGVTTDFRDNGLIIMNTSHTVWRDYHLKKLYLLQDFCTLLYEKNFAHYVIRKT